MFLEKLSEFDFLDFGEKFDAYVTPEFNKDKTKVKAKFQLNNLNGKTAEFDFSDFNVKGHGFVASMLIGEVRRRWYFFMKEKFGDEYVEAYNKNNKKDYNNKDLLDLDQK